MIVVALFQQMLGNAGMLNTFLVQHDLPILHIIGVPSCSRRWSPARQSGRTPAGARSSSWPRSRASTRSSTRPRPWTAPAAWQRLVNITLPSLKGLFILLLILRLGSSLSVGFEQIILQQGPVGLQASEVLDTWVYNNGIIGGNWGISAAAGLVKGSSECCW